MKKVIIGFIFVLITTTSNSKINKNEISESLKCAGIFTATQFIKQDELPNGDLAYKENSLAAAKVTRDFLSSEGVLDEKTATGVWKKPDGSSQLIFSLAEESENKISAFFFRKKSIKNI